MSSEKEKGKAPSQEGSSSSPAAPCGPCKHLRQSCPPGCVLAPYFSPNDADRFAAVDEVFDASTASDLLADLPPERRAEAAESLVYEAQARQWNPVCGCVSYASLLENVLLHTRKRVADAREQLAARVGRDAAYRPFDVAAAPPVARQAAEGSIAAALSYARERDAVVRADVQALVEAEAAKQKQPTNQQTVAAQAAREHGRTGRGSPAVPVHGYPNETRMAPAPASSAAAAAQSAAGEQAGMMQAQRQQRNRAAHQGTGQVYAQMRQEIGGAQNSADQAAREHDAMMMRREIAAGKQKVMPQQMTGAQQHINAAMDSMMGVARQATAEDQYIRAAMAQAEKEIEFDNDIAMIRQASAEAGLTVEQYMMLMMTMPQDVTGGQGMAGEQNMTMVQQVVAGQQDQDMARRQIANVQLRQSAAAELGGRQDLVTMQLSGAAYTSTMPQSGSGATILPFLSEETPNADAFFVQQLLQQAAAYANAMPGSGSGATIMPFLPGGPADAEAFLARQQLQLQPQQQAVNVQPLDQEEPSLPPLPPWLAGSQPGQEESLSVLPGGSANAEAFLFQQTVNAQASVRPSLVGLSSPRQQQTFQSGGKSANSQAFLFQPPPQQPSQVVPSLRPLQQNDGQSSDLVARYWDPFPDHPPGGRQ